MGYALVIPRTAFAFSGLFANFYFTAGLFGSGLSRDRPITAFLSFNHKPSRIVNPAKHQDILEFMFEFSTRGTFGRASGVTPPSSLNQTLKTV
jgi:hypothetical protein